MSDATTLAAIHAALHLPEPADGARDAWKDNLVRRTLHVVGALEMVANHPDQYGEADAAAVVDLVAEAATWHPVTYLTREQEQAAQTTSLRPPMIVCQHCTRLIAWDCGDWRHLDDDHRECDPDAWAGPHAEPVDDPAVREFAKELVGRRVGVALHSGEHLLGVLTESADWKLTVQVDGTDKPEELRFRQVQHVQPLEQHGLEPLDRYAAAVTEHLAARTRVKTPAVGVGVGSGIRLDLPSLGAVLVWDRAVGWYIYRLGARGQRTRLRFLGGQLTPTPRQLGRDVGAWDRQPASFPAIRPDDMSVPPGELDALLASAAAGTEGGR